MIKKLTGIFKSKPRGPKLLFSGFSMGLADLIPGVSGGTIAFLYGIYDELLASIKKLTGTVPKLLLQRQFIKAWGQVPFGFLIPLFSGMLIAIFGLSWLISILLDSYGVVVWTLFFGLVAGSGYVVSRRINKWTVKDLLFCLSGFLFIFIIVGLQPTQSPEGLWFVFLSGMIAFCAMILPGISGSLILVLLGQYTRVIDAVSSRNIVFLAILLGGGIIGLALFSRLLSWLLVNYHNLLIAFLAGMMFGSLRRLWPWNAVENLNSPSISIAVILALIAMFGFVAILFLERKGIAREN